MYAMGRGVPQSDTEAVTWFREAAEKLKALPGIGDSAGNAATLRCLRDTRDGDE